MGTNVNRCLAINKEKELKFLHKTEITFDTIDRDNELCYN